MTIKLDPSDVRERAHVLWEGRGWPDGSPDADWYEAERQLRQERKEARSSRPYWR